MNISTEDYMRTIYFFYEKQGDKSKGIKPIDIAKELKITKASVCKMIKKLVSQKYLKAKAYSRVHLTKKGLNKARRIMHNHRVIEVFLAKILNYDINKVHEEAHKLEHAFSEKAIKRLDKFHKNPKISPMGIKIPHNKI